MRHLALIVLTGLVLATPCLARGRPHLPPRPNAAFLRAGPSAPSGTLIRDSERLRTLELDELAPLRLRLSIPF